MIFQINSMVNLFKALVFTVYFDKKKIHRSLFVTNNPTLVQIMAWYRICDKAIYETMKTQFTDAYMPHKGEMSLLFLDITLAS